MLILHGRLSVCECAFGFEVGMWDLIVLVPDHCLSFYFTIGRLKICIYCYVTAEILTKHVYEMFIE